MDVVQSFVGSAFGASVVGSSHLARGKPNQDSIAWRQERVWTYIAVADGHGGAPHYRSDRGSRFAVTALIDLFRDLTDDGRLRHAEALVGKVGQIAEQLVARWRALVEKDLTEDPLSEPAGFASLKVYGSTCIGAAIGPGLSVMLQLGDGDLFVGLADRAVERPFLPDDLVGEQTYSICLPDAAAHVKIGLFTAPHKLSVPHFVIASTDGLGKSFQSEKDLRAVIAKTFDAIRDRDVKDIAKELETWLSECSRQGSGDDTSAAIFCLPTDTHKAPSITSDDALSAVPGLALDRQEAKPLQSGQVRPARRRSTPILVALAFVVGVVSGAVLDGRVFSLFARPKSTVSSIAPSATPELPSQVPTSQAPTSQKPTSQAPQVPQAPVGQVPDPKSPPKEIGEPQQSKAVPPNKTQPGSPKKAD